MFALNDGSGSWTTRIMAGPSPDGLTASFELESNRARPERAGPFPIDTAPPLGLETPDWAKGAVWYQILPERFRNGEPANDPRDPSTFLVPWSADWSSVSANELEAARARGPRTDRTFDPRAAGDHRTLLSVIYERRYGGDLQGVSEKLADLADLGVDAIYLCPVFSAPSLHKYDAADFRHIDDHLAAPGPPPADDSSNETPDPASWAWTAADRYFVDEFLPGVRGAGMRIIIDGVWNHTGVRFWAFRDILRRGAASPFAPWFQVTFGDDPGAPRVSWRAWDGPNGRLPRFRQTQEGDLVPPVKSHVYDVTRRWMDPDGDGDPSDGVDGWRLDVAPELGMSFWEDWCGHVKRINPDAFLLGEIWFHGGAYFGGRAFDAQMNYPFARAAVEWLRAAPGMGSADLARALDRIFDQPPQTNLVQANLLSSHDTQRLVSALANPAAPYDSGGDLRRLEPGYTRSRPEERIYDLAVLGFALQATYLGAPMIYCGEEWGMLGAKDPDCRKPVPWPDAGPYAPDDQPQERVRAAAREWLRMRRDPDVGNTLRYGSVTHLDSRDDRVFAFERRLNDTRVLVVLNAGDRPFDAAAFAAVARPVGPGSESPQFLVPPRSGRCWTTTGTDAEPDQPR